jgi:PPOX class probable F420-dependent enzyme
MTEIYPSPDPTSTTLSSAARRFLAASHFAVVATLNPDGTPLQAVVWYLLDGDEIVFNSAVGRRWPANLARDGRTAVAVVDGYRYLEVRGRVQIDDDPESGQAVIAALAHRYHEDEAEAQAEIEHFRKQRRVTFRLRPESVFERLG